MGVLRLPQVIAEPQRTDVMDGCQVVILTDRAQDLEFFLLALFDPE